MDWCTIHNCKASLCNAYSGHPKKDPPQEEHMSFGDFETVMSIIEKASEKDIADIKEMLKNREGNLALIRVRKKIRDAS